MKTLQRHLKHQIKIALKAVRKKQPWILLFGPSQHGKTTLLKHSGLDLFSPHQKTLEKILPTSDVDWWISSKAVFIDPPGHYCLETEHRTDVTPWEIFIKFIRHKRRKKLFDAIFLVLDAQSFLSTVTINSLIENLRERLMLHIFFNDPIPIFLIITHCDQLNGFVEFFDDLNVEEREQAMGFLLYEGTELSINYERFKKRYSDFLSRINNRTLSRLHTECDLERRMLIQEFPIQLTLLHEGLERFYSQLPVFMASHLVGVYYTSAEQNTNSINPLTKNVLKNLNVEWNPSSSSLSFYQKSYFINELFQSVISSDFTFYKKKNSWVKHLPFYSLGICFILCALFTFHQVYQNNLMILRYLENQLARYTPVNEWSPLNFLSDAVSHMNIFHVQRYRWLGFGELNDLQNHIQFSYEQLLRTYFVNHINQLLVGSIQNSLDKNPLDLYSSLKRYLLLTGSHPASKTSVKKNFSQFLKSIHTDSEQYDQIMRHFKALLQLEHVIWPIDHDIIDQAQERLKKYTPEELALRMLEQQFKNRGVFSNLSIPFMYQPKIAMKIYDRIIPHLSKRIMNNLWVVTSTKDPFNRENLTEHIRNLFIQNYLNAWKKSFIFNLPSYTDLKAISQDVHNALSRKDVLAELDEALNIPIIRNIKNSEIHNELLQIQQHRAQVNAELQFFDNFLTTLVNSSDLLKASYESTSHYFDYSENVENDELNQFLEQLQHLPEPYQTGLTHIWNQTLDILLNNTHRYLMNTWTSEIMSFYRTRIENRYPVTKNSKVDISVDDFNRFFGPRGILESFFNRFLKPFVDMTQPEWSWKKVKNKTLLTSPSLLETLFQASTIQKMFYMNSAQSPVLRFAILPHFTSSTPDRFTLDIGGQLIADGIPKRWLLWPGPNGTFVSLSFNSMNSPNLRYEGYWAWLRLLDHSTLEPTQDPAVYEIILSDTEKKSKIQLIADNPINPYSFLIFQFRCPESF